MGLAKSILKEWLDLIFPPLCKICKEPCATRLFCPDCWEMCALPDPVGRCRHCFEEMEEEVCRHCRKKAILPFPSAFVFEPTLPALHLCSMRKEDPETLAAFAVIQWERLDWPMPDVVIPLPKASGLARAFASWLGCFFVDVIDHWNGEWNCKTSILEEEAQILLISVDNTYDDIAKAIEEICEAFPKKIFVLSLTPLRG